MSHSSKVSLFLDRAIDSVSQHARLDVVWIPREQSLDFIQVARQVVASSEEDGSTNP